MSSRPLADRLLILLPLPLALFAMLLAAVPWHINLPLAPQVLWLATLTLGVSYPPSWPPVAVFVLGLIADQLSGTPLGSQALIALLMSISARAQSRRLQYQPFRVRWMEAAAVLTLANLVLWALISLTVKPVLPVLPVLRAAFVSALWFPLFYVAVEQLVRILPPRN